MEYSSDKNSVTLRGEDAVTTQPPYVQLRKTGVLPKVVPMPKQVMSDFLKQKRSFDTLVDFAEDIDLSEPTIRRICEKKKCQPNTLNKILQYIENKKAK